MLRRSAEQTLRYYPMLRQEDILPLIQEALSRSRVDPGRVRDSVESYTRASDRFREAFAIPQRRTVMGYPIDWSSEDAAAAAASSIGEEELKRDQLIAAAMRVLSKSHTFDGLSGLLSGNIASKQELLLVPDEEIRKGVLANVVKVIQDLRGGAVSRGRFLTYQVSNRASLQSSPAVWVVDFRSNAGYEKYVRLVASLKNLPAFVMAMFQQESSFNPQAVSSAGAVGIAQFMPRTWAGKVAQWNVHTPNGSITPVPERWDIASVMGTLYLVELMVLALQKVDQAFQQWRDHRRTGKGSVTLYTADRLTLFDLFIGWLTGYSQTRMNSARDVAESQGVQKTLEMTLSSSVAQERFMLLGAMLYNAGPGALARILTQLYEKRNASSKNGQLDIGAVDNKHAVLVNRYFQQFKQKIPDQIVGLAREYMQQMEKDLPGRPRTARAHTSANFPALPYTGWSEHLKNQPQGRLLQCFPTYCLILVQGGGWIRWVRLWDHFYGLFSVMSIDVHRSQDNPQHTAEILVGNAYRRLSNMAVTQAYAQAAIAGMRPLQHEHGEEMMWEGVPQKGDFLDQAWTSLRNTLLGGWPTEYERSVWNQELKALFLHPGERIHLRMGYGADAAQLPVVFNGKIAAVDVQGNVIRVLALGDGRELLTQIADESGPFTMSNYFGLTLEVRDAVMRILLARRADAVPVVGPMVRLITGGAFYNESLYGIESFGRPEFITRLDRFVSGLQNRSMADTLVGALGFSTLSIGEGEIGVNIYNPQHDSTNYTYGIVPLLDVLTLGLSNMLVPNSVQIALELKQGTVWDLLRNCQLSVLDFLMSVEPFSVRSTLFMGRGHQAFHYAYLSAEQMKALGIHDLRSYASGDRYWRLMRFRQYRQYHMAVSEWNLIANELIATSERMWNEAQAYDAQGVPGNKFVFDPAIVPEERKKLDFHSALSTTLMSQLSLGAESNWLSVLARIAGIRQLIGQRLGIAMPIRAVNNVAANLVREGIELMYDGQLVLLGAAEIKPHDWIFIHDELRAMSGVVGVREVEHHFSTQHGYTSVIVPKALVIGNSDADTINLAKMVRVATLGLQYYRIWPEITVVLRLYWTLLGWMLYMAFGRWASRMPVAAPIVQKLGAVIGTRISGFTKVSWQELLQFASQIARAGYFTARDFIKLSFNGAWTRQSMRQFMIDLLTGSKALLRSIASLKSSAIASSLAGLANTLLGLGAARPLFGIQTFVGAMRALSTKPNLLLLGAGTVLEMVNRHLAGYFPCRLYPVRVNGLPLTAGIRGHFGSVEGDAPSPAQAFLDWLRFDNSTLEHLQALRDSPKWLRTLLGASRLLFPVMVTRDVPAYRSDKALQQMEQIAEATRHSMLGTLGVYGKMSEIIEGTTPSLVGGDGTQFRRNVATYSQGDPPAKGDALLDDLDPDARVVITMLINELRSKGVNVAIVSGRRSLQRQAELFARYGPGRAARPTPKAPHVRGVAVDVSYRLADGRYTSRPPADMMKTIGQVVDNLNALLRPMGKRIRWLGRPGKGEPDEPWHFDVQNL